MQTACRAHGQSEGTVSQAHGQSEGLPGLGLSNIPIFQTRQPPSPGLRSLSQTLHRVNIARNLRWKIHFKLLMNFSSKKGFPIFFLCKVTVLTPALLEITSVYVFSNVKL